MPRIARVVIPEVPYHVTQRGNYQQKVFYEELDNEKYLFYIQEYSSRYELEILAYCLMDNHVHLIVEPKREDSMARTMNYSQMMYTRYLNKKISKRGRLWQERYYSCPLDREHLYEAVRYIENNPESRIGKRSRIISIFECKKSYT